MTDTPLEVQSETAYEESRAIDRALLARNESERRSRLRANITWAVGSVLAFFGTAAAFLAGVDWSVLFTPEAAALAGASVMFVRALVTFLQRRPRE